MEIKKLKLKGSCEIVFNPFKDNRGFFMRVYDEKIFRENGLMGEGGNEKKSKWENEEKRIWVQENHSKSAQKGVLRGLHFQLPPFAETKLIRCIRGRVQDVFVDLRKDSETFGQWDTVEISEDKFNAILVPRGFAHAICTLTENCEVVYKVDNYYAPEYERGLIWNDPDIGIKWPVENPILSEKDKKNKTFKELMSEWGNEGMRI